MYFSIESSDLKPIMCGVPQGSVLGPLLFLIYIDDLPNISNKLKFFLFADDANIYFELDSLFKLEKVINEELKKLNLRLNINRLSLNISKTNFIIFHPYNKPLKHHITLKINKKAIIEKNIKHLGIIIDSHLNWKHILNISKKISRSIGIICKLRPLLNTNMMKNIYYSLFHSHLIYAIQVWGSAGTTEINKLLVLQKRFLRIITYNDTLPLVPGPLHPTDSFFYQLEILKVQDVFKLQVSKFIFDCLHLYTPANFQNWFTLNHHIHNYNTRSTFLDIDNLINSNNLFIVNARTTHWFEIIKSIRSQNMELYPNSYKKQAIYSFLSTWPQKTFDSSICLINFVIVIIILLALLLFYLLLLSLLFSSLLRFFDIHTIFI